MAARHQDEGAPELLGDLREDHERAALWTLADLSRPGGVAGHLLMLPAMAAAVLLRPHEYAHC
ncbi:hypothetical protein ACQPXS_00765 [Streptomyces sp. CA-142005]|uniref:hypothetical protein n=1 Tax=Streptomyces sp. CA-142005 TaxID=3240052 RepID=UPI003D8E703D